MLEKEIDYLVKKNKEFHELNALKRFASIRTFFMFTQDFFPKEVRNFIGLLCLQNYDLTLNKKFSCMSSTQLQEMELKASQLIKIPKKVTCANIKNIKRKWNEQLGLGKNKIPRLEDSSSIIFFSSQSHVKSIDDMNTDKVEVFNTTKLKGPKK